jgi:hypothetical protein
MLQKVTVKKLILIIVCVCTGCISGSASNVCAFMRHLSLPLDVCQEDSLPVDSLAPDNQEENYVFTDSLAPDNPGFGGVFNAFDKILTKAPVIEQLLTDSLVGEGKDFSDLSKRKQKRLIGKFLGDQFTEWNNIDTTYITPQLYDFALMLQTTTSFENFTLNSEGENKQTLKFAPNPSFRLGGYFGWRWIFWGYNIDMNGLFGNKQHNTKKLAFDFSFYTSKVGVDLYYRKTGNDFRCTNLNSLFSEEQPRPDGISDDFNGLNLQTRGFNVYYIFNHRRFSYPAAFSQSTMQRKSAGTFKLGFSFTHHKVSLDDEKVNPALTPYIDPSLFFNTVKYNDYSINFGYAYNWVFAKNFLFCVSLSPGLAYNVTYYNADNIAAGSTTEQDTQFRHFSLDKLNIDFITRLALVYNNNKYFAGMSFRFHSFDYKNRHVNMNNSFAYLHFYLGFNFKKKKHL